MNGIRMGPAMGGIGGSVSLVAIPSLNTSDHQTVDLSISSAKTTELTVGEPYAVWSSVDCFIASGDSSVVVDTTGYPLTAKSREYITVVAGANYLAGIVSSGTGVLYVWRMN